MSFFSRYLRLRSVWQPIGYGLLGSLFVCVIGNLDMARLIGTGQMGFAPVENTGMLGLGTFGDIVRGVWRSVVDWRMPPLDAYWTPTRIIDGTVNEFPYFSFLFADLHPHMMAIPFSLLALVIALGIIASHVWPEERPVAGRNRISGVRYRRRACGTGSSTIHWKPVIDRFWLIVLTGIITGMLFPLNTWDYPTYLIIIAGSFFLLDTLGSAVAANRGRDLDWRLSFVTIRRAVDQRGSGGPDRTAALPAVLLELRITDRRVRSVDRSVLHQRVSDHPRFLPLRDRQLSHHRSVADHAAVRLREQSGSRV